MDDTLLNPFRPGAGHPPPYLAGRDQEKQEFLKLLRQPVMLDNVVLTGLRGIGKTVLMEELRPLAHEAGWLWVGSDVSESSSVSEENLAVRLITDLAVVTSSMIALGGADDESPAHLDYDGLIEIFNQTPGLVQDKLRAVLETTWKAMQSMHAPPGGVVFAYDEAQNLADQAQRDQYPLSLLLDVFQAIQRRGVRFLLLLTGLPTLFPKLVDARTFAERMFRVIFLRKLGPKHSREAISKPLDRYPIKLTESSIEHIVKESGGYPYFIQFFCREIYDHFLVARRTDRAYRVPVEAITRKLDSDFFAARWSRITDRQRELLHVIARLPSAEDEFTVQEIVEASRAAGGKPFSASRANQMLAALGEAGLVYKNRHGKYSFAVPMFGPFVLRQLEGAIH